MNEQILVTLIELAKSKFKNVDSINPEDDIFETLNIDSIEALNLLSSIEEKFNVEIPDYEISNISSFRELAILIASKVRQ